MIHSLENLQEELTGLYSRRHFKVRYQTELLGNPQSQNYAAVIFSLDNLADIQAELGHTAAQELIRSVGTFISHYFNDVGGFSTRLGVHQYTTLLPFSDPVEADGLVAGFAEEFKKEGMPQLRRLVQSEFSCTDAVTISISAGIAQGQPDTNVEPIIEAAQSNQKQILTFSATCKGRTA